MLKHISFLRLLAVAIAIATVALGASACSTTKETCGTVKTVQAEGLLTGNGRNFKLTTPTDDRAILSKACEVTFDLTFGYSDPGLQKFQELSQWTTFPLDGLQNKILFHVDNEVTVYQDWDVEETFRPDGLGTKDFKIHFKDHGDHAGMAKDGRGIFFIETNLKASAKDPVKISGMIQYYTGPNANDKPDDEDDE